MKIPNLILRKEFLNLYQDDFLQNILLLQSETNKEQFDLYPDFVKIMIDKEKNTIKKRIEMNSYANLLREHKTNLLIKDFEKLNLEKPILLKGIYLTRTLYKNCSGIRKMSDVDLLVPRKDFKKSYNLLKQIYETKLWREETRPITGKIYHEYRLFSGKQLFEIHKSQHYMKIFDLDYRELFEIENNFDSKTGGKIIPLEYMILFFLIHDLSQRIDDLQFKSVAEMYLMLYNADIDLLKTLVKKYNLEYLFNIYLFLIDTVFEKNSLTIVSDKSIVFSLFKKNENFLTFGSSNFCYKLFIYRKKIVKKLFFGFFLYLLDKTIFLLNKKSKKPLVKIASCKKDEKKTKK